MLKRMCLLFLFVCFFLSFYLSIFFLNKIFIGSNLWNLNLGREHLCISELMYIIIIKKHHLHNRMD